MQHFKFSLSSIASWKRASSCSCFFIPNLDFLKGREEWWNWGGPAMHNLLKLTLVEPISSAALSYLSSGFASWHSVWECHVKHVSWGGVLAEWAKQRPCAGIWASPIMSGKVSGRHAAPQHGVSELHGHVNWTWHCLFTSISSEHTFLRYSVRLSTCCRRLVFPLSPSVHNSYCGACCRVLVAVSSQRQNWWWSSSHPNPSTILW